MINITALFGSGIISGITLSPLDNLVDEIQFMVSCDSPSTQHAHTIYRNKNNKSVVFSSLNTDINVANTFSIIFQADSPSDIVTQDGSYFVLRDVIVELIP